MNVSSDRMAGLLRRQPVQQRGAATVTAILDACGGLLADHDYDEITTAAIAERAGVPIGSFYQYFADKRAVVLALTYRSMDQYLDAVTELFAGDEISPDWRTAVGQVFAVYLRMLDQIPGFGRVRPGDVLESRRLDPSTDQYALLATRLGELFAAHCDREFTPDLALAFRMSVETTDALLKLSERMPPEQRQRVLAASRDVVHGLLAPVLD